MQTTLQFENMATNSSHSEKIDMIGFLLHDVSRLSRALFDRRSKHLGVSCSEWWLLSNMFSVEGEVVSNNGLSRLLNITGTAIRKLIVALEKKGLVIHAAGTFDARSNRFVLSKKSNSARKALERIAYRLNVESMKGITAEEQELLVSVLRRMRGALIKMDGPPHRSIYP